MIKFQSNKKKVLEAMKDAENRALNGIGAFVQGEAIVRTPVDTGNLRSSIDFVTNQNEKSVTVGTNVEYAPYVEKGTRKQRGQAFLAPAVETNIRRIGELARELMKID
ncbi:hypothetical protein BHU72_12005 [Desulfuribacillus stibiiarsenatis]|uniref:HK97 gp10 family phage protein n=1 Tax=Desulfuribacillus stibiiarsenatis TaxID=1390249 RepID=A0A1E5L7Y5_9FIRM|nr:HK97-gp10 family putative phage morphogenesis protein [Desulfuribacillus stibiiarsenatis]OEH86251.1 hypothetical protein BHU72_12005 [Desulfuribacillus stibiiarsenatis]